MTDGIDINLKLRSEILEIALNIEDSINGFLLALLLIENPNRKAISNRSGNLSFKNKIDLLFDLDIVTSDEHQKLLLLMEFRNQFVHNIKCCSFQDAINHLGTDKGKKLLKYDDEYDISDKEFKYQNAFRNLNIECIKMINTKLDERMNEIEDRRSVHVELIESQIFFINRYFDVLKKVMLVCERNALRIPEASKLINQLNAIITEDMESLNNTKEYIKIQNKLKELHTPERIKSYFKR